MRKILFIALLLFSAGIINVSAQKGLDVGIGVNYNATFIINQQIYGHQELDYKQTTSFAYNLGIGYNFNNWIGIKTEVGMQPMGQSYWNHEDLPSQTRDIKLSYVTWPILARFSIGGHVVRFYALVGPQLAFLTKAEQTYQLSGHSLPSDSTYLGTTDVKNRYQGMDVMARIDFGVDFIIVKHLGINFGISGAYGLTDINASDWRMNDNKGEYKPSHNAYSGFNLGVRWCFGGFGKKE